MHSYEFVTTGNGVSVLNNGVKTAVINQDGTLNGSSVIDAGSITAEKLASNSVETAKVKDANITAEKLASNSVETAKVKDANITLAKLAAGIAPSNVIKFAVLGSTITDTTLTGLAVGDLVIHFIAATSTVTVKPCATIDTLPDNPADEDYIVVLRVAA